MTLTEKLGHLAWCALVALALARQNGDVLSQAQENLFLTRWLGTALKQRRFSHDVAPDIEWLLKKGRQLGISAKLGSKLNYLWCSCIGSLSEQNDLFMVRKLNRPFGGFLTTSSGDEEPYEVRPVG
ncbi:DUF2913 family protein [Xylella fastidiosa subsp. fastidiosa]|uniref:DUF2913 family protein n=3 Tax=Xylella fastidiosa TaxID=2371 RepID=B2I6C1_XYLF2|nr:DUF2913 family protein [Xylella fastidiosa]ADN62175.1 hypothetical protein XFLM_00765 [Xylella fastidiosa subsp. fastidiosa GB514]ACB92831.1 hypothetical protein XfasM23_1416 [Xylella fastidiosa M23]EGO81773.1 hypothetical protein XFEB_01366 [Xylella fastidiosa EB92.1]MBE0263084.1 DUF2913 family protein [Xylella fastidiosa subsp. fastidiosa]MBE0265290.1 DUF2913 family protein [Xylella fastidiosa subsp. fastidiosa]